jgi:hypothetical protein
MSYDITDYSFKQAAKLGVDIKPSTKKNKKIDVLRENKVIASIGDKRYSDYGEYLETKGSKFANERRRLFKSRFDKASKKIGSNSWWSSNILW